MWVLEEKASPFQEMGKSFVVVTSTKLQVYTVDLDAIRQVYLRKRDFERSPQTCENMPGLLTPSVSSVYGVDWQRHRRITAPPFNESNMKIVWQESLTQAAGLAQWWISHGKEGLRSSCSDTMTLALNVLAAAGLGYSWKYIPAGKETQAGDEFSARYRDNLALLLTSIRILSITPKWMYELGPSRIKYLPKLFRDHVLAAQAFRKQMRELVEERKVEVAAGRANENIFLNAIIAKSVEMRQEKLANSLGAGGEIGELEAGGAGGLNDDELFANMFSYNIAGHETTAHSLNYCLHILSVEPGWQDWIREEVDHVYHTTALDFSTLEYEQYFYRLKRCLALMYEMLRLYSPVVDMEKDVLGEGQHLRLDGRYIFVPKGSEVHMSNLAVHMLPEYWGADSEEFRPARWIRSASVSSESTETSTKDSTKAEMLDAEEVAPPPVAKESFFPWSLGARNCPGKKFAQVEFVAVMSYVLRLYKVEAVPLEGESKEETRRRVQEWIEESKAEITTNFREPEKYALRLVSR
ncbi:hypothetical protein KVR01_004691 [Diaporthe batatas]|uniref:uncharacterized protein n=1 Tax=Diaporthe batatas TaxID=748121 RepID=UPI001D05AEBE|nr:uncharacterized protein KVR01_004691 [Diaporthe batatas]KAG8166139.1 hypothetical protein KVR01_004691 [Diaporthe batatas]